MKIFLILVGLVLLYFIKINIQICSRADYVLFSIYPFNKNKYCCYRLYYKPKTSNNKKSKAIIKAIIKHKRLFLRRVYFEQLIINYPQIDNAISAINMGFMCMISYVSLAPLFNMIQGYSRLPQIGINNQDNYYFKCIFSIYLGDIILKGLILLYLKRRQK